jgi:prepilin-type N-terminal cleavage/methylation domain-containing protein
MTGTTRNAKGMTLVELLVGMTLGLVGAAAMTALLRVGTAAWERSGADAEAATEIAGAIDQLSRDLRIAGYDPKAAGIAGLTLTEAARVEMTADLDGDGAIDPDSDERIGYRWSAASGSLLRLVGRQSLPILSDVATGGFRLAYFDRNGAQLDPADPATGAATRVVTVDLATAAHGRRAGVHVSSGARLGNR